MSPRVLPLLAVLLLAAHASAARAKSHKVTFMEKLPAGKTLRTYPSPNHRATLVLRDEHEHGDFVWRSLYCVFGKRFALLDKYVDVAAIRWAGDSRSVKFRGTKAVDFNKLEHEQTTYRVGQPALTWKVTRTFIVEH